MISTFRTVTLFGLLCFPCFGQTPMDVQPVKKLTRTNILGTCAYQPTEKEAPFYNKLDATERVTGSFLKEYSIQEKRNHYVSWFGIVRGIVDAKPGGIMTLLLEQKFFDGMTDCHILLVSIGDRKTTKASDQAARQPRDLAQQHQASPGQRLTPHYAPHRMARLSWGRYTCLRCGPEIPDC
jgi:hypothetical protein